jgi:protein-L-isoaspartate O-methyltransferase
MDRRERALEMRRRARGLSDQKVEVITAPTLFPTPKATAEYVIELADIGPGMRVLEPSAGTGALLDELPFAVDVVAVEIMYSLVRILREKYPAYSIVDGDFLEVGRGLGVFDRIVMNPPFDHGLDIKHIIYARSLLSYGGRLVAICADGPRQRETFEPIADLYEPLPEDTFAAQGTRVRTAIVVIEASR